MIAPVYEQNARGRNVYLPEDMLLVRFRSAEDYCLIPMEKGRHWIDLDLNEMPLFIRKGCIVPLSRGGEWVEAVDFDTLTLLGWLDGDAAYAIYNDDGTVAAPVLADGLREIRVRTADGKAARSPGPYCGCRKADRGVSPPKAPVSRKKGSIAQRELPPKPRPPRLPLQRELPRRG